MVLSQTFSKVKLNPVFQPDIVVLDAKKEKSEAKQFILTHKEFKSGNLDELVAQQKKISAKNLRKLMKEYEKKEIATKLEKGEDIDLMNNRKDSTIIDTLATKRSMAFWDSIRTVPLTKAEIKSYVRLDSLIITQVGTKYQKDSIRTSKRDSLIKHPNGQMGNVLGKIILGESFKLTKRGIWRLDYVSPFAGLQLNTVEGVVLNGGGIKVRYSGKGNDENKTYVLRIGEEGIKNYTLRNKSELVLSGLTRYSFARNQLLINGGLDYSWKRNQVVIKGGRDVVQFDHQNPINPFLNSVTTLLFEQNFAKTFQKKFLQAEFRNRVPNEHFELSGTLEYAQRSALQNLENLKNYRWIDWRKRSFTPNTPFTQEIPLGNLHNMSPMTSHNSLVVSTKLVWKPWQIFKIKNNV